MSSLHRLCCALLATASFSQTLALPATRLSVRQNGSQNGTDASAGGANDLGAQVYVPLAVIGGLFIAGMAVACFGRRFRRSPVAASAGAAASGPTELTADQLVGGAATTTTAAGTQRARRARRTRRTPSQISTHSLPAYMKEPGDQEIVIVRGADDMEDDIPITVTMPPVDEDSLNGSMDTSHEYPSDNQVPLLTGNDLDDQHLSPDHNRPSRASFDSIDSSAENSSHHYADDAPAYETVILDDPPYPPMPPTSPPPMTPTPAPGTERSSIEQLSNTRRRSVFASIFNPRHSRGPSAASPEPRPSTSLSVTHEDQPRLSIASDRRSRALRHQASHSGSGSMLSLLSRTRSNGNLNGAEALTSPSMISLHSISAPLSHTLVKTEFTYPKGGPTADQIRLISSRESLARFGRPYGADAIAFAASASASRADLEPPPGFEEASGGSGGAVAQGRDSPSSNESGPLPESGEHVLEDADETQSPSSLVSLAIPPASSSAAPPPPDDHDITSPTTPVAAPSLPASSLALEYTSKPSSPSPLSPPPPSTPSASLSSRAPPSAFKNLSESSDGLPPRAASRASSFMSFATANESLDTPATPGFGVSTASLAGYDSAEGESAPPTPRTETRHFAEGTDTTVTNGDAR
ncbi:uncharacterized protein BXZ73DRAFT_102465 [Epithele typhae]|uniref:uncharacterized protein n=1 Tax=Epithele typhae TaxID=378194 RepID=UPI00200854B7|nr:uncharacterized protein BXZ73DRAFT_102465 [Epithele typhae]KAH9927957.1 hypothetical protein BXZ73DRAFT_102465 [Epithele typhae]